VAVSTPKAERRIKPLQRLLESLREHLEVLDLTVSFWDPSGEALIGPTGGGPLCQFVCGDRSPCLEAMARLAQRVCLEGAPAVGVSPIGCRLLGVPVRQRRRQIGGAVACFPTRQMPDNEDFARACGQADLDCEVVADLCRKAARHDADEAETLCRVLEWLIRGQQAQTVAGEELRTLSTNLANTYEELSLLYRISGSMKVTQSNAKFFESVCGDLVEVMQLQAAAAVLSPRPRTGADPIVVWAGDLPLTGEQLRQMADRYLAPRLHGSNRTMIDNHFAVHAGHLGAEVEQIRSLIAVPLMSAEHCKGILLGINKHSGEFNSIDQKLISSICNQAAVFLENHHLFEDLQDLLMGLLHALTSSIDAKDPYTCGHSRRVAQLSRKLAELSGFDDSRAERVYLAGLLHDVGKIGVPEAVLCKAGRLTDEEYECVKLHPETGAMILGGIRQMEDVLPVVLYHHERPDGRGYPKNLTADQIPIEALIVGLADSFDAMTSSRTYRAAMPLESVMAEIRRCSGTQFDAHLVERLLSLDLEAYLQELRAATEAAPKMTPRS